MKINVNVSENDFIIFILNKDVSEGASIAHHLRMMLTQLHLKEALIL